MEIFAAQDAIDVVDADLDVREPALLDDLQGIGRRRHLSRIHPFPPACAGD
jgi:hypothetical protein